MTNDDELADTAPMRVMETEVLFLDDNDVPAAIAVLTAQGYSAKILDTADMVEGVVVSPAKWVLVRGWGDIYTFLDLMKGIVGPLGGDVSDTSPSDSPLDRSGMN